MNPAQVSMDTLTATMITSIFSLIVGILLFIIQRKLTKSEHKREEEENAAKKEREEQRKLHKAEHNCTAAIARAKIVTMAESFEQAGVMSVEARRTFDALYESYEAMGEDGLIKETVEHARSLPMYRIKSTESTKEKEEINE